MRIINSNDIAEVVKGMCIKANCHINKDIKSALSNSVKTEKSDISKGVIENLLKNAEIADSKEVVVYKRKSCNRYPRYKLCKVSDYKEQCVFISVFENQIYHIEECWNTKPPYKRITERADTLFNLRCNCSRIVPYRTFHNNPFIPT